MKEKAKEGTLKAVNGSASGDAPKKRRRWDIAASEEDGPAKKKGGWEAAEATTPSNSRCVPFKIFYRT